MGQYLIRNGRAQCTVETVENCRAGARAESSTVALNEATAAYAIGRLHATAYQTSRAAGDHGAQKNMRISRGRTVLGVLLVPTAFTLLWMTVFGNTAIHMILTDGITDLATAIDKDTSLALFAFLQHFPFASVISMVAIIMVVVFFVTSADSGAMVVDMLASGGAG